MLNNSQRGPFTVNIMNGVGWAGVPTLPLRPLQRAGLASEGRQPGTRYNLHG